MSSRFCNLFLIFVKKNVKNCALNIFRNISYITNTSFKHPHRNFLKKYTKTDNYSPVFWLTGVVRMKNYPIFRDEQGRFPDYPSDDEGGSNAVFHPENVYQV